MKHLTFIRTSILIMLISFLVSNVGFAVGTPAGTKITNVATIDFTDLAGNALPQVSSNIVEIIVAQVAGVDVSPATASQIAGANTYVNYPVTVTNTGNGPDTYNLTAISTQGWAPLLYHDANRDGILQPNELAAGPITVTPVLAADETYYLIARFLVPDGTPPSTADNLTVTAVSQFNPAVSDFGVYTTVVSAAVVKVIKTQSRSTAIPGDEVLYTLSYLNDGVGDAANTVITDVLDLNLTLVAGTISGGGTYDAGTRTITWNIGDVPSMTSGIVTFRAKVNDGVLSGTKIYNSASLTFIDVLTGLERTGTSNTTILTVLQSACLSLTIDPPAITQDIGLPVQYKLTLTNCGNAVDRFSFAYTSSLSFAWQFYVDVNNNGVVDGGDYLLDFNSTGDMLPNGVLYVLAVATIPISAADQSVDNLVNTFTSLFNPAQSASVTGVTTVRAPQMTLTKSFVVVGGGEPIPGAIVEFTLTYTNNGTGASNNNIIRDVIPTHTTYVPNSVFHNGVQQNDSDVIVGNVVTINAGTVAGNGGGGTIKFRVTIN